MRTILSTLGVIIGVASLVTILALGDGLERFTRDQIERTTDLQRITVTASATDRIDGIVVRRDSVVRFSAADVVDLSSRLGTDASLGREVVASKMMRPADSTRNVAILVHAVDSSFEGVLPISVKDGRFFAGSSADSNEVVVSAAAAATLLPNEATVGMALELDGRSFRVAGILDGPVDARPLRIFVPLTDTIVDWLDRRDQAPVLHIRAMRIEDVERYTALIDTWVSDRFGEAASSVTVGSSRARVQQAGQAMLVFKLAMASIAAVSLLVGGIGIMNILLASVSERTREIGIRKAMGAREADIRRQFLGESIAISGLGSLIGVLLGMAAAVLIAMGIRALTDAPLEAAFTWQSIVAAAGAAILVGLVFGTYPARKAGRLSPIDAIRHE
jgi:putative ABC transport system permease protein